MAGLAEFVSKGAHMREGRTVLAFEGYELNLGRGELRRDRQLVDVPPTPLRVLLYLADHRDRIVSRTELFDAIWRDVVVGDEALTTALAEARSAVGDDGTAQRVLRTHKGRGYRFVAEAVEIASDARAPGRATEAAPASGRTRWRAWLAGGAALLALTAVAFSQRPASRPAPAPFGIVVLPLSPLTSDAQSAALAGGLTDQITSELVNAGYPVVARTTAALWKERGADVRELRGTLGVSHAIEGSVQRERDRLRVTMQLVATLDGQPVWSEVFDHPDGDRFAAQDRVTARVSTQAFNFVFEDRGLWDNPEFAPMGKRYVEMRALALAGRNLDALALGDQIVRELPEREPYLLLLADTHAFMAAAWRNRAAFQLTPFGEAGSAMLEHARASVRLAPELDHAHLRLAEGLLAHWRWSEAEPEVQRVCELRPRGGPCGSARWQLCAAMGCPDDLPGARLWVEQNPGLGGAWQFLTRALMDHGQLEEALVTGLSARELGERFGENLPALYLRLGRPDEAVQSLVRYGRGRSLYAFAREIETALAAGSEAALRRSAALLAQMDRATPEAIANSSYLAAEIYALLGERELALQALERSLAEREAFIPGLRNPAFDAIRDTPRFRAILAKLGLTSHHAKYLNRVQRSDAPSANEATGSSTPPSASHGGRGRTEVPRLATRQRA